MTSHERLAASDPRVDIDVTYAIACAADESVDFEQIMESFELFPAA